MWRQHNLKNRWKSHKKKTLKKVRSVLQSTWKERVGGKENSPGKWVILLGQRRPKLYLRLLISEVIGKDRDVRVFGHFWQCNKRNVQTTTHCFYFHIKQAFSSKSESTITYYVSKGKESLLVLSLLTTSLKTELSTVSSYHPEHCTQ